MEDGEDEIDSKKPKDDNENIQNKRAKLHKEHEIQFLKKTTKETSSNDNTVYLFLAVCIIGVILGISLEIINIRSRSKTDDADRNIRKYAMYAKNETSLRRNGQLKHVYLVLERSGYKATDINDTWDLLWAHDYPFTVLQSQMKSLKSHQKVNHFPSSGFITMKVELATTPSKYIPKAFKLPAQKEAFRKYASETKQSMFLEKDNQHRNIYLKNASDIDLEKKNSFLQEYVTKPLLVDGYKFDIGVYVVVTSVNPLRVYWYQGDVLFRYCPKKYYPFDPSDLDKYVIGDDYLPTWKVPALQYAYTKLGLSMKDSFELYAKSKNIDTKKIWDEVPKAIAEIFLKKEHHLVEALKRYPSKDNFFELVRFDLIVDEDLNVYLLEANMSPNLSSSHFPPNQLLYEQMLYNLMSLTGVSQFVRDIGDTTQTMIADDKNIAVYGVECSTFCKEDLWETKLVCGLCKPLIDEGLRKNLLAAYREFIHRADFARLYPPSMVPGSQPDSQELLGLTKNNRLQYLWYQGKCNIDVAWC